MERYADRLGQIVERNRAEMALIAAKQEAESAAEIATQAMIQAQTADRAKTEFLANMSHELRTPLNAIIGFSDIIRCGLLDPESKTKFVEYAEYIYESGTHLLALINDILDLSKIQSGRLVLSESDVALDQVVDACVMIIGERAKESGIRIERQIDGGAPRMFVDERKIKQVLINLLSNAVKFTPKGGVVTLGIRSEPSGECCLIVSDTGIGIAREHLAKVLVPFWQVEGEQARRFQGTGLGLPLSKALVDAHGGKLEIESEIGVGTAVIVRLPATRRMGARGATIGAGEKAATLSN